MLAHSHCGTPSTACVFLLLPCYGRLCRDELAGSSLPRLSAPGPVAMCVTRHGSVPAGACQGKSSAPKSRPGDDLSRCMMHRDKPRESLERFEQPFPPVGRNRRPIHVRELPLLRPATAASEVRDQPVQVTAVDHVVVIEIGVVQEISVSAFGAERARKAHQIEAVRAAVAVRISQGG